MNFWDSSALLPLVIVERQSPAMLVLYRRDPTVFMWWGTRVELVSALARRNRADPATEADFQRAIRRTDGLVTRSQEVSPSAEIREITRRLLFAHPLRAADSLQLAAAIVLRQNALEPFDFVTLDRRLAEAAAAEGFRIVP